MGFMQWILPGVMLLGLFVEISPVKINPITWIIKPVWTRLMQPTTDKIDKLEKRVESVEESYIAQTRRDILDFANSCRNNRRHTLDEFKNIINDIDLYHVKIMELGLTNGYLDLEAAHIINTYKECRDKNSFL